MATRRWANLLYVIVFSQALDGLKCASVQRQRIGTSSPLLTTHKIERAVGGKAERSESLYPSGRSDVVSFLR